MLFTSDKCHKLYDIFFSKFEGFVGLEVARWNSRDSTALDMWSDYIVEIGCSVLERREVDNDFFRLMNEERCLKGDLVCIPDPASNPLEFGHREIDGIIHKQPRCDYLLVPEEFALKALVLGALP